MKERGGTLPSSAMRDDHKKIRIKKGEEVTPTPKSNKPLLPYNKTTNRSYEKHTNHLLIHTHFLKQAHFDDDFYSSILNGVGNKVGTQNARSSTRTRARARNNKYDGMDKKKKGQRRRRRRETMRTSVSG